MRRQWLMEEGGGLSMNTSPAQPSLEAPALAAQAPTLPEPPSPAALLGARPDTADVKPTTPKVLEQTEPFTDAAAKPAIGLGR